MKYIILIFALVSTSQVSDLSAQVKAQELSIDARYFTIVNNYEDYSLRWYNGHSDTIDGSFSLSVSSGLKVVDDSITLITIENNIILRVLRYLLFISQT